MKPLTIKRCRWTGIKDVKLMTHAEYTRLWRAAKRLLDARTNLFLKRNKIT